MFQEWAGYWTLFVGGDRLYSAGAEGRDLRTRAVGGMGWLFRKGQSPRSLCIFVHLRRKSHF